MPFAGPLSPVIPAKAGIQDASALQNMTSSSKNAHRIQLRKSLEYRGAQRGVAPLPGAWGVPHNVTGGWEELRSRR